MLACHRASPSAPLDILIILLIEYIMSRANWDDIIRQMIEIPRLENNEQHSVCLTCRARLFQNNKYYCDEEILRQRPMLCPVRGDQDKQTTDAYAILKQTLRTVKRN